MSTQAQVQANQANALRSTGPVTEAGKQIVSGNPVKHGLAGSSKHAVLPGARAEFEKHLEGYLKHFSPVGPEENRLVVSVAENSWRVRRAHATESALFEQVILEKDDAVDPASAQAQAWIDASKGLQRIALYANRIQRSIDKDSAKLDALQSARKAAYAKAQEEAILLTKLAQAKGNTFDPASHFPPDGDFGGFAYASSEIVRLMTRASRLEEARARFAPQNRTDELTMRDLESLIG